MPHPDDVIDEVIRDARELSAIPDENAEEFVKKHDRFLALLSRATLVPLSTPQGIAALTILAAVIMATVAEGAPQPKFFIQFFNSSPAP